MCVVGGLSLAFNSNIVKLIDLMMMELGMGLGIGDGDGDGDGDELVGA